MSYQFEITRRNLHETFSLLSVTFLVVIVFICVCCERQQCGLTDSTAGAAGRYKCSRTELSGPSAATVAVLRAPDWAHCIAMLSVQPNIRKKK